MSVKRSLVCQLVHLAFLCDSEELTKMIRVILQIFLTIHLFKQCVGICAESYETRTEYGPQQYNDYEQIYEPGRITVILTKLTVDCEKVELPLTWRKQSITMDYDCGGCTQVLNIFNSNISFVPSAAFKGFSTFTVLRISELHLEKLKPGAFNSLHSLKELYLFGNKLRVLGTGIFNSLANLEVLDLSKNKIQNISADSLTGVTNLKKLNLSSNRLVIFESAILDQNIVLLEHVDLSFNILSNIDLRSVTTKIENLDVSNNNIKDLSFCPFELISLNLSKNSVTLSEKYDCLSFSIVHFDASYNNISELDTRFFSNLTNLEYLNLQHNNISAIPTGLFSDLSNLTSLNLSHNKLQQFQFGTFEYLENLQILDISHNKITTLNRFLHPLLNLTMLYIQANNISFLNGMKLLEDLPNLSFIDFESNEFSCNELLDIIHYFRRNVVRVEYGRDKNTTNIHGISCSDDESFRISSTDSTSDVNSEFEGIILSKLQQLANGDLKKSVVNDYFNNEFKNSNFYKYLENFHGRNLPKFNETTIFNYFNEDFENSKFYKYLEGLKDNDNFTMEFSKRMFQYFDNDFQNSNFVKYLNELKKADDDVNDNFANSVMYKYFNKDFKNSYFYKYLENLKNSKAIIPERPDAEKFSGYIDEQNNRGLFTTMVILLILIVILKIIFLYMDFTRRTRGKKENVELLEP